MNKCDKCGFMHYRTDPCRKSKPIIAAPVEMDQSAKPKRTGNRHRPGYFTVYMREYRKGLRRRVDK